MTSDWLEIGDDIPQEEHEEARRWVEQEMDERYPGWRSAAPEEKVRLCNEFLEDFSTSAPGQTAHLEQEIAFMKEVVAFSNVVQENIEDTEKKYGHPLTPDERAAVFIFTAEGYFGGFTSLAVNVCASLGYELTNYVPADDRVFEDDEASSD